MKGLLRLLKCELMKLKRKRFIQLALAASFLFPIALTALIHYLNISENKYGSGPEAFDALWQSVLGFGMLMLLPSILGVIAALLFFMERDNDTFKSLRVIPVTSTQMVLVKFLILAMLSVLFCLSSTIASVLCGLFFFEVAGIGFKLFLSAVLGCLIALSALPLVLVILLFSRSYIFSVMLCVFYSVFNLMSTFLIQQMPKILTFLLPTPSIMLWSSAQISASMAVADAGDLQAFTELGLIPSTPQLLLTLGAIGAIAVGLSIRLYKKRSD